MAVKVNGLFQNPQTKLIYQSPVLWLIPNLDYPGKLNLTIHIVVEDSEATGVINYYSVDKSTLVYPTVAENPYEDLINALENYAIDNLQDANEINSESTFEIFEPA